MLSNKGKEGRACSIGSHERHLCAALLLLDEGGGAQKVLAAKEYVTLRYVVLFYVTLCYVTLRCVMLCYVVIR
jgi:hypothetical protein